MAPPSMIPMVSCICLTVIIAPSLNSPKILATLVWLYVPGKAPSGFLVPLVAP